MHSFTHTKTFSSAAFFEKVEVELKPEKPKHLIIAMSSDKGLCGAIHASIGRAIRSAIPEKPESTEVKIICVGDKQRATLNRSVLAAVLNQRRVVHEAKIPVSFVLPFYVLRLIGCRKQWILKKSAKTSSAPLWTLLFRFRFHADKILMHFADVGRKPPTFSDAGMIANSIMNCGMEFDNIELYYNVFKYVFRPHAATSRTRQPI